MKLTRAVAQRVLEVVDAGLVWGIGKPVPGQMCVEAAVCFALGEPHGDAPSCVGDAVRAFKIKLNDSAWSSDAARARGLRRIAVAQLGSNQLSQVEFVSRLAVAVIREILPPLFRRIGLGAHADACAAVTSLAEGQTAASAAASAAAYAFVADADAAAYAADASAFAAFARAARAAAAASDAAAYAARAASVAADAAVFAASVAYAASVFAADADADAADADAADAVRDQVLCQAADLGARILVEMGSPGAQWLDLTETVK